MNSITPLNRRSFIAKTAAASIAAGVLPSMLRAAESPLSSCPIVVFSKIFQELKLGYEEASELTAEAGLDGVDCPVRPGGEIIPERASEELPRYAAALAKHRLKLALLTTAITSADSPHARDILTAAGKLGIKYYRLGFFKAPEEGDSQRTIKEVQSQFKTVAALSKETGLCALFQNHVGSLGANLPEVIEIIKPFDPAQIGLAFDIGHALVVHGNQWRPYYDQLKSHLRVVYIKDAKVGGSWVPFGQGDISKTGYFGLLKDLGYNAPISLHIEFDWSEKGKQKNRAALLKALKESTKTLRGWLAT